MKVSGEQRINRLRLGTGLVMFGYITAHLVNLSLGLISIRAMNAMLVVVIAFWGSLPVQAVLLASIVSHFGLALRALWRRRTLRLPPMEAAQMLLGFMIPFMLALHVAKTRVAETGFGAHIDYTWELLQFWVLDPVAGVEQVTLLLVAWTHACIGIHFNLKLRRWYPSASTALLIAAYTVPLLALIGFARSGYTVWHFAQNPAWIARLKAETGLKPAITARLLDIAFLLRMTVLGAIIATIVARLVRKLLMRRRGLIRLTYSNGRSVRVLRGTSVLEASRDAAVPHVSICGGRGRCSTCRTRIAGDPDRLPEASDSELSVLSRMKLPANVRLACQLRPQCDLVVTPLLAAAGARRAMDGDLESGSEREITVLFCDLRGFTTLSEHRLPFDVVFLLNSYFAEMGRAIEGAGGRIDKFIGDGIMALFGVDSDAHTAARQALAAAAAMSRAMDRLNRTLAHELAEPLRIGIGLHAGTVVLGEMGHGAVMPLTAIGDCVNTASRLESLTKEHGVELIVSHDVERLSGIDLSEWPLRDVTVRGRDDRLPIRAIPRAQALYHTYERA
jgi:adenylate cyclase